MYSGNPHVVLHDEACCGGLAVCWGVTMWCCLHVCSATMRIWESDALLLCVATSVHSPAIACHMRRLGVYIS